MKKLLALLLAIVMLLAFVACDDGSTTKKKKSDTEEEETETVTVTEEETEAETPATEEEPTEEEEEVPFIVGKWDMKINLGEMFKYVFSHESETEALADYIEAEDMLVGGIKANFKKNGTVTLTVNENTVDADFEDAISLLVDAMEEWAEDEGEDLYEGSSRGELMEYLLDEYNISEFVMEDGLECEWELEGDNLILINEDGDELEGSYERKGGKIYWEYQDLPVYAFVK